MPWIDGRIRVSHPREPWDSDCPKDVAVFERLGVLTGEKPAKHARKVQYNAAKKGFDADAATEIVQAIVTGPRYDAIVESVIKAGDAKIIISYPHPAFENGYQNGDPERHVTNALPFVFAEFLAERLDAQVDENIEQIAKIGRTKMDRWQRFLYQPCFRGDVAPGAHYIIVDDVVTLGATFAALRSHIVSNGGIICAVAALAHKDGVNQPFPILAPTIDDLRDLYGDGLFEEWKETIGHDVQKLTQPEGSFLCEWGRDQERKGVIRGRPLLQRVRTRLDQAASNGSSNEGARRSESSRRNT